MITEDYVSYETAKLLKEKGFGEKFDEFCPYSYSTLLPNSPYFRQTNLRKGSMRHQIYAPTLQMVRKWLIENYNIHIEVRYFPTPGIYRYVIIHSPATFENIDSHPQYFKKEEEACEAGIRYCLENLI